jgi:CheY-like chemotaxis protein
MKTILIVDDDAMLTSSLKRSLEGTGRYVVHVEGSALGAVDVAAERRPDLVILDVIMPDGDGTTMAAEMMADPRTREIPILFLSSSLTGKAVERCGGMVAGHPFLAKPADMKTLMDCIDACIEGDRPET